ncbi:MAG: putative acyl-CoA synthetase YngI [Herpetosiphonaceae bacterium]|nr:MAG: putative acyl-CoA synthetase YngI [Herpetosiphonaceae bacterium]
MDLSELGSLTVGEVLRRRAAEHPDKEFVIYGEKRLSYRAIDSAADAFAAALQEWGIGRGDPVAVLLPNSAAFIITLFAAARIGAPLVPLNIRYRHHELDFMLNNSRARALVVASTFAGFDYTRMLDELRAKLPHLQRILTVGGGREDFLSFERVLDEYAGRRPAEPPLEQQEDIFTILYTSGTTGTPKGAMLSHANVVCNAIAMAEALEWTADDTLGLFVPMFHVFGITPSILSATVAGSRMVILENYTAEAALQLIERERITIHHGVPTMFILELNHPNFSQYDLSSLRTGIIAAAPCPVEIVRRIRTEMGCNVCVGYGLTETSPCLTITRFDDSDQIRSETVGRALPGIEIKIVDDQRREVPHNTVGELAARGYPVMKGYFEQPEATRAAIDDEGWFYTGDLATIDEQGYIRIVGRKKEMIIRGGFKIYPREIEEIYYAHPKVQEVAIVGVPDPVLGERAYACIKLREGLSATAEDLLEYVRGRVADYKVPDKVIFVEQFPMTASGKIRKVYMAEQLAAGASF